MSDPLYSVQLSMTTHARDSREALEIALGAFTRDGHGYVEVFREDREGGEAIVAEGELGFVNHDDVPATGKLWWNNGSPSDLHEAMTLIRDTLGTATLSDAEIINKYDIVFTVNRARAVELGWATSTTSEEWLEEDEEEE